MSDFQFSQDLILWGIISQPKLGYFHSIQDLSFGIVCRLNQQNITRGPQEDIFFKMVDCYTTDFLGLSGKELHLCNNITIIITPVLPRRLKQKCIYRTDISSVVGVLSNRLWLFRHRPALNPDSRLLQRHTYGKTYFTLPNLGFEHSLLNCSVCGYQTNDTG